MPTDQLDLEGAIAARVAEAIANAPSPPAILGMPGPALGPKKLASQAPELAPATNPAVGPAKASTAKAGAVGAAQVAQPAGELMTLAEAGELIRASRATMFRRIRAGRLRAFTEGGRTLVLRSEVFALVRPK